MERTSNIMISSHQKKFSYTNPFTSGGVIAERVYIVETRHKVFPILGEASWRVITDAGVWHLESASL